MKFTRATVFRAAHVVQHLQDHLENFSPSYFTIELFNETLEVDCLDLYVHKFSYTKNVRRISYKTPLSFEI